MIEGGGGIELPVGLARLRQSELGAGSDLGVAVLAAFGAERAVSREVSRRYLIGWAIAVIGIGVIGVFVTAALLARINWRSRDFNLKTQRRNIRLINVTKGKPAVQPGS